MYMRSYITLAYNLLYILAIMNRVKSYNDEIKYYVKKFE